MNGTLTPRRARRGPAEVLRCYNISLSDTQRELLVRIADADGLTLSEAVRAMIERRAAELRLTTSPAGA
jgi:hypothetical protein